MFVLIILLCWMIIDISIDMAESEAEKENRKQLLKDSLRLGVEVAKIKVGYEATKFALKWGGRAYAGYKLGRAGYKAGKGISDTVKKRRNDKQLTNSINSKIMSGKSKLIK